jgi:hypothetical protein
MNLAQCLECRGYIVKPEGSENYRVEEKGGLIVKGHDWYCHSAGPGGRGMTILMAHLGDVYDELNPLVYEHTKAVRTQKGTFDSRSNPLSSRGREYLLGRSIEADLIDHISIMNLVRDGPKGFLAFMVHEDSGKVKCISQRAYDRTRNVVRYDRKSSNKKWSFSLKGNSDNSTIIVVEGPIDALSIACLENQKHHKGRYLWGFNSIRNQSSILYES